MDGHVQLRAAFMGKSGHGDGTKKTYFSDVGMASERNPFAGNTNDPGIT